MQKYKYKHEHWLDITGCCQQLANKLILTAAKQAGIQSAIKKQTNAKQKNNKQTLNDSQTMDDIGTGTELMRMGTQTNKSR